MISLSTPIAFITGGFLIVSAIQGSGANADIYASWQSLAIVLGGTLAATLISYDLKTFLRSMTFIFRSFGVNSNTDKNLKGAADFFCEISELVKSKNWLAIEQKIPKSLSKDVVFMNGMDLLLSGAKKDQVIKVLNNQNDAIWQRYTKHAQLLNRMGNYAPGFGVLGTIIGLIAMMSNLDGDMGAMGKALAIAFITTFYGIALANFVFKPAASALIVLQEDSHFRGQLLIKGFSSLADRQNEQDIRDQLSVLVNPRANLRVTQEDAA